MNAERKGLCIALFVSGLLQAGPVVAQETETRVVEERTRVEVDEARFEEKMKEAEERLAEAARQVAELSTERLEKYGEGRDYVFKISNKPRLGVNIGSHERDGGPVDGVTVVSVTPGSAAADAGMRAGDLITAVNGEPLEAESQKAANLRLLDFMGGVEEGDVLTVTYRRDGKVANVEVEPRPVGNNVVVWSSDGENFTMPRPPEVAPAPRVVDRFRHSFGGWRSGWGDMEVVELTEGLGRYFGTDEGLLVISAPKSNDFKLQEGDVIQSIDGRSPVSVDHCMRILTSYQPGETLELRIMRDKRPQTIRVSIPDTRTSAIPPAEPASAAPPAPAAARPRAADSAPAAVDRS